MSVYDNSIKSHTSVHMIGFLVILLFTHRMAAETPIEVDGIKVETLEKISESLNNVPEPMEREMAFRGRQLADIKAEASGARLPKPMKNGRLQRDSTSEEIKIEKETPQYNGKSWYPTPMALVSEDCGETNVKTKKERVTYEDRDMELSEKNSHVDRKPMAHVSDSLLSTSKGISHLHIKDKSRRHIPEAKARISQGDYNEGVNLDESYSISTENRSVTGDEKQIAWRGRYRERDTFIRFNAGPPAEKYLVPTLKITDGTYIFKFLSGFFGCLHPFDFPTELLRDVIWKTLSVPQLILQSVRVEIGFIVAIIFAVIASLVVPVYGICCIILALMNKKKSKLVSSTPPPGILDEDDFGYACERRILALLMQILLIISLFGIGIMVIGNEFASDGAELAGKGLKAATRDLTAYFQATHRELAHVLIDSADQAIAAAEHDLENIEELLGEPIQKALGSETGLDVAIDALNDIISVSLELSSKVQILGVEGSRAISLALTASKKLEVLRRQLYTAKTNCTSQDRPLCDTIDTSNLDIIIKFDMLSEDKLKPIVSALNAQYLRDTASYSKENFLSIPKYIANQSKPAIEDVREALAEKRTEMRVAERSLAKIVRHLTTFTTSKMRNSDYMIKTIESIDFWRWLLFLIAIMLMSSTIMLLMVAVYCGCCGAENQAGCLLKSSVVLMCLLSIPLWSLVIISFITGGHGDVFICRPLYDEPEFRVLGKLLDDPGMLYNEKSGLFKEVFKEINDFVLDKSIRNILNECKENKPAYPVFNLRKIVDLNVETAHWNWSKLEAAKGKLVNSPFTLGVETPSSQSALMDIMTHTDKNFRDYRLQLENGPLTGKDLTSLADQLESISNQISDISTLSNIESLVSKTRGLMNKSLQPLEQVRRDLVYKLTELEIQIQPFQRQINQSLSHLKTIQYYIDNQGSVIVEKKTQDYINRLTSYLEQYRGHVLDQVERRVAPCGPIWDIYDAGRSLICRHYIDSLNGFWLGLCSMLILWMMMTPLALKMRHCYRAVKNRRAGMLLRTISHQNSSENATISEQSAWSTPGCPPPDNWR